MDDTYTNPGRSIQILLRTLCAVVVGVALLISSLGVFATPAGAITPGTPSMIITASSTTNVGLQIFANVNLRGGANPTGTISYSLFGPGDTSCTSSIFTTSTAVAGTSMNSNRFTTSVAGSYRWQATYSGDANNSPYGPTSCSDPSATVPVSPVYTGFTVAASPYAGGMIHATGTVGGFGPTGTINFLLTPPGDTFCSTAPVFSSTVPVNGSGSYNSANFTPSVAGSYKWRAIYSGDVNNYHDGPTACLDANAAVDVPNITPTSSGISLNPSSIAFPAQTVGTSSGSQTITLSSTGGVGLFISSISLGGANSGEFQLGANGCSGVTVPPGGTCAFAVSFSPASAGNRSASISVADNAPGSPHMATISGQAVARVLTSPQLSATASAQVLVGSTIWATAGVSGGAAPSGSVTISLFGPSNSSCSGQPLTTSTKPVTGNGSYSSDPFTTLLAGSYRFNASYSGDANNNPATTVCGEPKSLVTVLPGAPAASISPAGLTFADTMIGSISATQTVTVTNTGNGSLAISSVKAAGSNATDFGVSADGCTGVTVAAGASCSVAVTFAPVAAGTRTATLTAVDNAGDSPQAMIMSGRATTPSGATFTNPVDGQVNVDTSKPFTWTTATAAQGYYLGVGSSKYGVDLANSGVLPASQSSFNLSSDLPTGKTVYATLWTEVSGTWSYFQALTFTASLTRGTFTNPVDGQVNVDTSKPFTWTTIPAAQGYYFGVGSSQYGVDLANSGVLPASQSSFNLSTDLPTGKTLYATLWTEVNGMWSHYQAVTFTASPTRGTFTNPLDGQVNVDTSKPLTWSTIPAAQAYYLGVGTTLYGADLVNSGALPASQSSFSVLADLPTAKTLFATLWTQVNGAWSHYQAVSFTAAAGHATFSNPVDGQVNVATSKPFTWTTIPAAQGYYVAVGTAQYGADLANSGVLPASQSSFSVPALPAGKTLYATLWTEVNGSWSHFQSVTFTA